MEISIPQTRVSSEHIALGNCGFYTNNIQFYEFQCRQLDQYVEELRGKHVLFLYGGIGRLANYAKQQGILATCVDLSSINKTLAKRNYPDVPFKIHNISKPIKGWDAIYIEDMSCAYNLKYLKVASLWQSIYTIYPKTLTYYVYRFNSLFLDQALTSAEPEGREYFKKILSLGVVRLVIDHSEMQDLLVEKHTIDLNTALTSVTIPPVTTHTYQAIGQPLWRTLPHVDNADCTIYNEGVTITLPHVGEIPWTDSPEMANRNDSIYFTAPEQHLEWDDPIV
jgi:hypothetical protein